MSDERIDAGGGRVPDDWRGPVTEHGHDRSGRKAGTRPTYSSSSGGVNFVSAIQYGIPEWAQVDEPVEADDTDAGDADVDDDTDADEREVGECRSVMRS